MCTHERGVVLTQLLDRLSLDKEDEDALRATLDALLEDLGPM